MDYIVYQKYLCVNTVVQIPGALILDIASNLNIEIGLIR